MSAKIQIKNDSVHNFGRLFFCINHFRKSGLVKVIDNTLGFRGNLAKYSYSEIFESKGKSRSVCTMLRRENDS